MPEGFEVPDLNAFAGKLRNGYQPTVRRRKRRNPRRNQPLHASTSHILKEITVETSDNETHENITCLPNEPNSTKETECVEPDASFDIASQEVPTETVAESDRLFYVEDFELDSPVNPFGGRPGMFLQSQNVEGMQIEYGLPGLRPAEHPAERLRKALRMLKATENTGVKHHREGEVYSPVFGGSKPHAISQTLD